MASRRTRMKASDVDRERNYIFVRKATFEQAFPTIDDITIEVEEQGDGVYRFRRAPHNTATYRRPHLPGEFIDCSNPRCYNGGFAIGSILRYMVSYGLTEHADTKACQGYEGSPKGRKMHRPCMNMFNVRVSLTYKNAS